MTLIAHLSDLHILDHAHRAATLSRRFKLKYLNIERPIDAEDRCQRLLAALREADRLRADHIVITGDLTEEGLPAQFEVLAEVLARCPIDPSRITLIPGNHDAYDSKNAYDLALCGPLDRWRPTSLTGRPLILDQAVLLPLSTTIHQSCLFAIGVIGEEQLGLIRQVGATVDPDRTFVVLQHHPPRRYVPVFHGLAGLRGVDELREVLRECPRTHVLHGHTHRPSDRRVTDTDTEPRLFCAPAVVTSRSPLRLYRAVDGKLLPVDKRGLTPLVSLVFAPSPAG